MFNVGRKFIRYPPTGANGLRKRYAGDGTTLRPRDYVEVDETDQPASRDERRRWPSAGDEYKFLNIGSKGRDDKLVPTLCRLERRRWDGDGDRWVDVDEADRRVIIPTPSLISRASSSHTPPPLRGAPPQLGLNRWVSVGRHMPQDDEVLSVARACVAAAEAEVAKRRERVAAAEEEAEQVPSTMQAALAAKLPFGGSKADKMRWEELREMDARDEEEEAEFQERYSRCY